MFFKIIIIFILSFYSVVFSQDAKSDCRTIHHVDVDSGEYTQMKCSLNCMIHGKLWAHNLSEGHQCPESKNASMFCKDGKCLSTDSVGFIDVEITTAEAPHKSNAYVEVCIKNSTLTQTLPLRDRSSCGVCKTPVIENTAHPVWNRICPGSGNRKWLENSSITLELWDRISDTMHNFLGGINLNTTTLEKSGQNHQEQKFKLNPDVFLFARITWTKA